MLGSPPAPVTKDSLKDDLIKDFLTGKAGKGNQDVAIKIGMEEGKEKAAEKAKEAAEAAAKAAQALADLLGRGNPPDPAEVRKAEISAKQNRLYTLFEKNVDLTRRIDELWYNDPTRKSDPEKFNENAKQLDNEKSRVMKEIEAIEARLAELGVKEY